MAAEPSASFASLDYLARGARLIATFVAGRVGHVNVQVTNRCNMRCGFCTFPERGIAPADELSTDDWRRVARKLAQEGSALISIEGGEPLLRNDVPEIVEAFARHHHPFVYTNGWFVTPDLARDLFRAGAVQVGVSLDYATPARHDASRRLPGAFDRAVAAVEMLRDKAPRAGRQAHLMTIILDDNLDELDSLLALSARLRVRHMITLLSTSGIYRSDRAQKMPARSVSGLLFKLKAKHPHFMFFRSYVSGIETFLEGRPPACGAGLNAINIDHRAKVSSCIELAHHEVADLLTESWATVKRKLAAFEEPRTCTKCWTLCRGTTQALAGPPKAGDWWDFFTDHL